METDILNSSRWWAHTEGADRKREEVHTHLTRVAEKAAQFAAPFSAIDEAYDAGLLHDLGKYGILFQRRLDGLERGIDHWTAGAWKALHLSHSLAIALVVEGHHIGLQKGDCPSLRSIANSFENQFPLQALRYSEENDPRAKKLWERFSRDGLSLRSFPESVADLSTTAAAMLDIRMLFSALVDADFLETEAHFEGKQRPEAEHLQTTRWLQLLEKHVSQAATAARSRGASNKILNLRATLRKRCQEAAELLPGLFTLTAPTGTGKTLAMLEFALRHAQRHGLNRIVFIAPYLSILDQTADAIRKALELGHNPQVLLEHHSLAIDGLKKSGGTDELVRRQEMLAENWDAPLIVTTNVQFFESLFSNRPSACRKLHRLANAVLCFDEVQSLPLSVVLPTLASLARLSERYGATVLFSTATQPAFTSLADTLQKYKLTNASWAPREINRESEKMFRIARRVRYIWPQPNESLPWSDLADMMLDGAGQALCILNTKPQAIRLFRELQQQGGIQLYHLSTSMCPAHRLQVLDKVRALLEVGKPCLLTSTQCVEAGVDLDFPRVFRAVGPLDSIVQAAGRCNRNQRVKLGEVRIFRPEISDDIPAYPKDTAYQNATEIAINYRDKDLHDPAVFTEYYRELYCVQNVNEAQGNLCQAIKERNFPEVARLYKIIDEDSINVLTPFGEGTQLAEEVLQTGLTRDWIRRARPYCVNVPRWQAEKYATCFESIPVGYKKEPSEDWLILLRSIGGPETKKTYDSALGIQLSENPFLEV
jgi:CRISPR-associated endonuclease/helicase Cas3